MLPTLFGETPMLRLVAILSLVMGVVPAAAAIRGRGASGEPVAAGVYLARWTDAEGNVAMARVTRLR
jgi:hypothetical protein